MVLADTPVVRDRRERILNAAMATFMDLGYCGSSMDEITRRAQVSKATVYAHFTSKEELFIQVVERACRWNFVDASPRIGATLADSLLGVAWESLQDCTLRGRRGARAQGELAVDG